MANRPLIGVAAIAAITAAILVSAVAMSNESDMGLGGDDITATVAYPDRIYGGIHTGNGSPLLGDESAPVTLVEFGDYQCHFCEIWHAQTLPLIKENYISSGRVNLVFVDYAFLGKDSPQAAHATYCADEQGMYWEYHDMLYDSQQSRIDGGWASASNLAQFASMLDLDMGAFDECMSSDKYADRVTYNRQVGSLQGVEATPTFFVVGSDGTPILISGAQPYATFARVLNSVG